MNSKFEDFLMQCPGVSLLKTTAVIEQYIPIDLSIENEDLKKFDIYNIPLFERYWKEKIASQGGTIAFGGYQEIRNLYQRSELFEKIEEKRNIHIGLDLWADAKTPVFAGFDGVIYGSQYNAGLGDYGATLVLKHQIFDFEFYTLYGHLSLSSIEKMTIGTKIYQSETIGYLGNPNENGGYAPHLHFQIIRDMQGNFGDYPGVCSSNKLSFYAKNCPNPNLLLKL